MPDQTTSTNPPYQMLINGFCERTLMDDYCEKNKDHNSESLIKIWGTFKRVKPELDRSYVHELKTTVTVDGTIPFYYVST